MQQAQHSNRVTVYYIGTLDNGKIFDQRDKDQPLSFTIGRGEIFPALEQEIIGMTVGEVKNICLTANQAYGQRLEENLLKVSCESFPTGRKLRIGEKLSIELGGKEHRLMRVKSFNEQEVLLDGNADLAGCELTFALQLVAIE
jgi:peptidylprolyl isomerase